MKTWWVTACVDKREYCGPPLRRDQGSHHGESEGVGDVTIRQKAWWGRVATGFLGGSACKTGMVWILRSLIADEVQIGIPNRRGVSSEQSPFKAAQQSSFRIPLPASFPWFLLVIQVDQLHSWLHSPPQLCVLCFQTDYSKPALITCHSFLSPLKLTTSANAVNLLPRMGATVISSIPIPGVKNANGNKRPNRKPTEPKSRSGLALLPLCNF